MIENNNSVVEAVVDNICKNCKECFTLCRDITTYEDFRLESSYCKDGSGYIDVTVYRENGDYVETCKLKHPGDPCINPFPNLVLKHEPYCNCVEE